MKKLIFGILLSFSCFAVDLSEMTDAEKYDYAREIKYTGVYEEKYDNGNLKLQMPFKNGERDGEVFWYHENGQFKGKALYKNNKIQGEYSEYYENGKIYFSIKFIDGLQNGKSIYFNENGSILEAQEWDMGIMKNKQTIHNNVN